MQAGTVEAIAKGQNRILLVMATGTGKTYTAFQFFGACGKPAAKNASFFSRTAMSSWTRPWLRVSPCIKISPPDYATGYLRSAQEYGGVTPFFFIDLKLRNTGKSMAKSCQPFLSAVGEEVKGKWQKFPNWVPTPVYWVLDGWEEKVGGKPTAETDLIPLRPYYFTIGYLTPKYPDTLGLTRTIIATGQREAFKPGKYCFEVTAYALDAEPITKYFLITWKGQCPVDFKDLPAHIEVKEVTRKPWWTAVVCTTGTSICAPGRILNCEM